jgi:hypothetical protein
VCEREREREREKRERLCVFKAEIPRANHVCPERKYLMDSFHLFA